MDKIYKIFFTLIYIFLLATFYKIYRADIFYARSELAIQNNKIDLAEKYAVQAISLNAQEPNYLRQLAKISILKTLNQEEESTLLLKQQARILLEESQTLNEHNLATIRNNIPLYYFLAARKIQDTAEESNFEEGYKVLAKEKINEMKRNYPNDAGVQVLAYKFENKLGLEDEKDETRENIKRLRHDLLDWHPDLITQ